MYIFVVEKGDKMDAESTSIPVAVESGVASAGKGASLASALWNAEFHS